MIWLDSILHIHYVIPKNNKHLLDIIIVLDGMSSRKEGRGKQSLV